MLGASGDPKIPGLGFRYDEDARWPYPNPTGRDGVMEGLYPPHHSDMRTAVEAVTQRKFGPGGPFHRETPGSYLHTHASHLERWHPENRARGRDR
jgi:hypothetical protein